MTKTWKIYGIRYATQNGRLASHTFLWGSAEEELAGLDYYSWVLVSDDRAIVVGGPSGKGENTAGGKADDAPFAVENLLVGDVAEPDPVFDPLLDPGKFDARQPIGG